MRFRIILLLILLVAASLAGCRREKAQLRGTGAAVAEPRPVPAFSRVTLATPGLVIVTPGDADTVVVEGDDNIVANIRTDVIDGDLIIAAQNIYLTPHPTVPVTVRVTGKAIHTVNVNGIGEGRVAGLSAAEIKLTLGGSGALSAENLDTQSLNVSLGGTGRLTATGRATRQVITIAGQSLYQADGLASQEARVTVSDSSRAVVRVSDSLDATVINGGTIDYIGSPTVVERVVGSGQVRPHTP